MFTVSVLVVPVSTRLKLDGLVETIVPVFIVGTVTVPFAATAKPDKVKSVQSNSGFTLLTTAILEVP